MIILNSILFEKNKKINQKTILLSVIFQKYYYKIIFDVVDMANYNIIFGIFDYKNTDLELIGNKG